ncbi:MAG: phosphate ABC transporter substrate-binding protein [Tumebacillaceae bacterium]
MFGTVSKKMMTLGVLVTMTAGLMVGCGSSNNASQSTTNGGNSTPSVQQELTGKVTASGSTALLPLVKQAASEFQDKNPKVTVDVTGGGSGTGQKQVAEGSVDIGNSDVAADAQYKDKNLVDHQVVVAPFILITNKDTGVTALTKDQAGKIFTGDIKNWKDVGGKDEKITIIGRAESSGSRKYIKSAVLPEGKDFVKDALVQDSSGSLRQAVSQTAGSIGYVDAPYANDTITVLDYDGVKYSAENVENGTYKLFAYEHMFTKGEATGAVKAFIDYIMSDDFQANSVEKAGFIPMSKMKK